MRPVPADPVPFSTPRAWSLLSRAFDLAEKGGILTAETRRALAFGRLSPEDAAVFCALAEEAIGPVQPIERYLREPALLPRARARAGSSSIASASSCATAAPTAAAEGDRPFLKALPPENQLIIVTDMVEKWGALGADKALFKLLMTVTKS